MVVDWVFKWIPHPPMAQQPLVGHDIPIIEASGSHSDTPHKVELL